jgi:hypothetical protein
MTQKLGIATSVGSVRTISVDDPKILLPCGKRTDQLNTEQLRQEMKKLPIDNVTNTSGKMELLHQLTQYVASITVIQWPKTEKQETR